MTESQVFEIKKHLVELVGGLTYNNIINKLLNSRKVDKDGNKTFGEVEHDIDSGKLKITAKPIDITEITKNGKGSCRRCSFGKGFYVINIPKSKLKDPRGHMVLDTDPPEYFNEEQKKEWSAKKAKETTWKIVKVCDCAIKESIKKHPNLVADSNGAVFIETDYTLEKKE
jgi:hypothetical protein